MTTLTVSQTYNGLPVRGYFYAPSTGASQLDLVICLHGTITAAGVDPLSAANKFLQLATDPAVLNIGDRLLFCVAYPQDNIPGWTQAQANALFPGINLSTFYFGDNYAYVEAALLWAINNANSYMASNGLPYTKKKVFTFGHSQGGSLVHQLNTHYTVDGVVSNAPGPIDLLKTCSLSEAQGDNNPTCLKLKNAYGSTTTNPAAYNNVSAKNYLTGLKSPVLYTQGLAETGPQVSNMQNILEPGVIASTKTSGPIVQFKYYPGYLHEAFIQSPEARQDIRAFLASPPVNPTPTPIPEDSTIHWPQKPTYVEMFQELLKSSPYAVIELFELHLVQELHGSSDIVRFHSGVNQTLPSGDVIWQSNAYQALPIEVDGFEYSSSGQLPRPKVRVANLLGSISALLLGVNEITPGNDLTGAKFIRIRTLSRFLDPVNFVGGVNPYGTPSNEEMPREIYYVDRKSTENKDIVEFELAAIFDLAGIRAPKRQCIANICQWTYRSPECGYTGTTYFNEYDDTITMVPAPNIASTSATLGYGQNLVSPSQLVSSNGWYRAVMQYDANLVVYSKNDTVVWSTNSVFSQGTYKLRNGVDGNLSIQDSVTNAIKWQTSTASKSVGVTSVAFITDSGGLIKFVPSELGAGRVGGFGWELFGPAYSGGTATATSTFYSPTTISPGRFLTLQFTANAGALDPSHFSGQAYNWVLSTVSVTAQSGFWTLNETFNATVSVKTSNPFRNTPNGVLTYVGPQIKITGTTGFQTNSLILQDDGNLVLRDVSNNVLWASGYSSTTEPMVVSQASSLITIDPTKDICGKRLSSCKARFGENAELPFGSFPSLGTFYG